MSKDYSEDLLIQESVAHLLESELGWQSVTAWDHEVLGENGTLGRRSYREVVLTGRLHRALRNLNPWMTGQATRRSYGAHDGLHEQSDANANQ